MKKCYRFFGGLLNAQEKWLNKMADKGYRLIRTSELLYEFEQCGSKRVRYCVEFIGQKSKSSVREYHNFLEDMGYRVFYKNINLNYSVGKIRWRPWAEKCGQIAANGTTFNRELLIVEREDDGKPFSLHTTYEDKQNYYKSVRKPYLFLFAFSAILGIVMQAWAWGIFAAAFLVPAIFYQIEVMQLKRQARTKEW